MAGRVRFEPVVAPEGQRAISNELNTDLVSFRYQINTERGVRKIAKQDDERIVARTIQWPARMYERLERASAETGNPISAIVRHAVDEYLARRGR